MRGGERGGRHAYTDALGTTATLRRYGIRRHEKGEGVSYRGEGEGKRTEDGQNGDCDSDLDSGCDSDSDDGMCS